VGVCDPVGSPCLPGCLELCPKRVGRALSNDRTGVEEAREKGGADDGCSGVPCHGWCEISKGPHGWTREYVGIHGAGETAGGGV